MTSSIPPDKRIRHASIDADYLTVHLMDGRRVSTPLAWYPRLAGATRQELEKWEIIGAGEGLHWEQFDEDLSVDGMLQGYPAVGYKPSALR